MNEEELFAGPEPAIPCRHTDFDVCQCSCHLPTASGEPMIIHIIACCEPCSYCGRNTDRQMAGITS